MASETDAGRYLIHKAGRGWYRPDAQGYTLDPRQAGRYSFDEAVAHSRPNSPFGPRDGITVKNESEVDGACPAPEYAGLVERLREQGNRAANWYRPDDAATCDEAAAALTALTERNKALEAEVAALQDALVQHNDRVRSAVAIAHREGAETNWKAFRGECHYTLAEYHELTNEARAALGDRP